MRESDPRDPSLALCQICANRDHTTLAEGNDGAFHRYNTCLLWVEGKCNDFVPGNIQRSTLQKQAEIMMANTQYGRFQA